MLISFFSPPRLWLTKSKRTHCSLLTFLEWITLVIYLSCRRHFKNIKYMIFLDFYEDSMIFHLWNIKANILTLIVDQKNGSQWELKEHGSQHASFVFCWRKKFIQVWMTWGWVNDGRMFIWGWTVSLSNWEVRCVSSWAVEERPLSSAGIGWYLW